MATTVSQSVSQSTTLADLDCGFSRPAAADRPGSRFGLWVSGSAGSSGFGLWIFAAGGDRRGSARAGGFGLWISPAGGGRSAWVAINFIRISVECRMSNVECGPKML